MTSLPLLGTDMDQTLKHSKTSTSENLTVMKYHKERSKPEIEKKKVGGVIRNSFQVLHS